MLVFGRGAIKLPDSTPVTSAGITPLVSQAIPNFFFFFFLFYVLPVTSCSA